MATYIKPETIQNIFQVGPQDLLERLQVIGNVKNTIPANNEQLVIVGSEIVFIYTDTNGIKETITGKVLQKKIINGSTWLFVSTKDRFFKLCLL